ncbi:inositol monophosphatase family protein [Paenibacillus planticolens]|nr:inositol monophosphatase [Paenibacillus planticolens]
MNRNEWSLAKEVAVKAASKAGDLAREHFGGKLTVQHKDERGDLVTEVDVKADRLIVDEIMAVFPTHRIYSEEAGEGGAASDWVWHVDPLDGTNNFALGIPLYGVSISLSYQGRIVLGVVHDSALGITYAALKGEGSWQDGIQLAAKPSGALAKSTLSWIQGHAVGKDDQGALTLRHHLEHSVKRVLRMWAPSLTWAMLARGDLHGIALYNSEGEDLYAGLLLAQEAGVKVTDFDGNSLDLLGEAGAAGEGANARCNEGVGNGQGKPAYIVAAVPEYHAELLQIVQQAIK